MSEKTEVRPFIPFGCPDFGDDEVAAVSDVVRSGWVGMGQQTVTFEKELANFCGRPEGVLVNSCTSALFLSLIVHGVGVGDEVIVPSLTWYATANVALYAGTTPILCDVDPATFNVTPDTVKACLTPKTKAVIVVHFGGYPVDIAGIRSILPSSVALIEDAAHAMGGRYLDGGRVGSSGNMVCFSFYANKNLSTGEGGFIAIDDKDVAERLRGLRLHGLHHSAWQRYQTPSTMFTASPVELGYKMNYTDLQASIGRVQLKRLEQMQKRRLEIAEIYAEFIAALDMGITLQVGVTGGLHARHLFVLTLDANHTKQSRNAIILALRKLSVGAALHYTPMHTLPLYEKYCRFSLKGADLVMDRILTLPISGRMTTDDAHYICQSLQKVLGAA
ncbi:DegT/DnrJ/EryC1/StrS family aminotransferase [Kordiimonas sp.]|uniref:DegT/DnrJ/EryC1/StrS family aminotransferase n=1 Tax=Kordiimonas sp. TaxID=1970157 RepID=UPI003B52C2D3